VGDTETVDPKEFPELVSGLLSVRVCGFSHGEVALKAESGKRKAESGNARPF
jgi:hypothetical protein